MNQKFEIVVLEAVRGLPAGELDVLAQCQWRLASQECWLFFTSKSFGINGILLVLRLFRLPLGPCAGHMTARGCGSILRGATKGPVLPGLLSLWKTSCVEGAQLQLCRFDTGESIALRSFPQPFSRDWPLEQALPQPAEASHPEAPALTLDIPQVCLRGFWPHLALVLSCGHLAGPTDPLIYVARRKR